MIPLPENAPFSIRDNFESRSKDIDVSDLHSAKHDSQITSTEAGTSIAVKPLPWNVDFSNRVNFDSEQNEIDFRDWHCAKHQSQITSTEAGTSIDVKPLS
jgi:hypothetical protein